MNKNPNLLWIFEIKNTLNKEYEQKSKSFMDIRNKK